MKIKKKRKEKKQRHSPTIESRSLPFHPFISFIFLSSRVAFYFLFFEVTPSFVFYSWFLWIVQNSVQHLSWWFRSLNTQPFILSYGESFVLRHWTSTQIYFGIPHQLSILQPHSTISCRRLVSPIRLILSDILRPASRTLDQFLVNSASHARY